MNGGPLFDLHEDWEIISLGEIAARGGGDVQTGPFGSQLHASDYVSQGIPLIMPQNIKDDLIDEEGIARIRESDAVRLDKYRLRQGDIVYSRRGDVERRALVNAEHDGWLCGTGCLRVRFGTGHVLPTYALYYLSHPAARNWVVQHAIGATMPNLNTKILSALPFVLPPMSAQEVIASALSNFDDKIELNRKTNETLVAFARAIFRDWFVDFGPTRRKMEGATDEHVIMGSLTLNSQKAAALAALFPASISDNGLPEGWQERPFVSFLDILGGGTPKTKVVDYWGGDIPWFSVADTPPRGGVFVRSTEKMITEKGLTESSATIISPGTTIVTARGTVGNIAMAACKMAFNQSCYALRANTPVGNRFIYLATEHMIKRLQAMAHGSVFSTITKATFENLSFPWAGEEVFGGFEELLESMFAKIDANGSEIDTLAANRNLLLPKLMSGELRLCNAEANL